MKSRENDREQVVSQEQSIAQVVAVEGDGAAEPVASEDRVEVIAFEGAAPEAPEATFVETEVVAEEAPVSGDASADVLPALYGRRFGLRMPRFGRKTLIGLAAVFLIAFSGVAYATYDYDQEYNGKLYPGVVIAGVDVGGMTPEEAYRAVTTAAKVQLDRNITVRYEDKTWVVTPRKLGAKSNARQLVDAAFATSEGTGVLKKVGMAVFGGELDLERDLGITYPRQGVHGFISGIASTLDRDPIDADVDYSTGWLKFVEPKEGRTVQLGKSRHGLMRALRRGGDEVRLAVKTTKPEITEHKWDKVLLLRIGENKLYLYEDGKITHEYTVATGLPEYPTPTGEYYITEKRYLPTWVNPDPTGWGASMPASIPPGPGNPLGTRALNWSASGIRFHGTEATYSLGYNASHGCVRMAMSDVEELYELVDVGTPIVSLVASPVDPMYDPSPGSAN